MCFLLSSILCHFLSAKNFYLSFRLVVELVGYFADWKLNLNTKLFRTISFANLFLDQYFR